MRRNLQARFDPVAPATLRERTDTGWTCPRCFAVAGSKRPTFPPGYAEKNCTPEYNAIQEKSGERTVSLLRCRMGRTVRCLETVLNLPQFVAFMQHPVDFLLPCEARGTSWETNPKISVA